MSAWVVARNGRGLLAVAPVESAPPPRKRRRHPRLQYGRPLHQALSRRRDAARAARATVLVAPPKAFVMTTGSTDAATTLVAATGRGDTLASRVPRQLLLPGQQPPTGGLSFVCCSRGGDDRLHEYRRPKVCSPVVTLSFDAYCGRADRDTRAFELYQPGRTVESHAFAAYHGCMHFQQPEFAATLPTDDLITRVAGTVRAESTATIVLDHPWCTRTLEFSIGIAQGPHQTWLLPLRTANARHTHRVEMKQGGYGGARLLRAAYLDTVVFIDSNQVETVVRKPAGATVSQSIIDGHVIDIEWHDLEYSNRHNADI